MTDTELVEKVKKSIDGGVSTSQTIRTRIPATGKDWFWAPSPASRAASRRSPRSRSSTRA